MQNKTLDERYGWGISIGQGGAGEYPAGEFQLMRFLEAVREAIKDSPWKTFDRFAMAHGYSHSAFSNKLNGKSEFSLSEAARLCGALGLSLDLYYYFR